MDTPNTTSMPATSRRTKFEFTGAAMLIALWWCGAFVAVAWRGFAVKSEVNDRLEPLEGWLTYGTFCIAAFVLAFALTIVTIAARAMQEYARS